MGKLELLPLRALIRTSDVDHADWNYRPLVGWVQRIRFRMVGTMLSGLSCDRLLQVGYGSGVFMPHLKRHCRELYGLDPHDKPEEVARALAENGTEAKLLSGSVTQTPFEESFFDCVVIVSALEYVDEIDAACRELLRVLRPDGHLVVVTPGFSPVVDLGLRLLTGESARENYDERREALVPAVQRHFAVERELVRPAILGALTRLYTGLYLRPKSRLTPLERGGSPRS